MTSVEFVKVWIAKSDTHPSPPPPLLYLLTGGELVISASSSRGLDCVHSSGRDLPELDSLVDCDLTLVILPLVMHPYRCGTQTSRGAKSSELRHTEHCGQREMAR